MPGQFLSQAERERLQSFPSEITPNEIITFFTLSDRDLALVKKRSGGYNLLGFALQLGTLRYLSFIPDNFPQQNDLASSFAEYGRMIKTIFILRYLMNQPYRRKINNQLNKGERLHDLRRFLFFAHQGAIRQRQEEELTNQASCLNLITNAVVTWNTLYMEAAINQLRSEGHFFSDEDINRLSPTRYEHVNPYGIYPFDIEKESKRTSLRPLRKPSGNSVK